MANVETFLHRFRRRAVFGIQTVFVAGALFGMLRFPDLGHVTVLTGASILVSCFSMGLAYRGRMSAAVTLLSMQFIALPYPLAWLGKGIYDVAMLMATAGIVAIGVMETPRRTMWFALANLAGAISVAVATTQGWTYKIYLGDSLIAAAREAPMAVIIVAFSSGIGILVSLGFSHLMKGVSESNEALEAAVEARTSELRHANKELRDALSTIEQSTRELVRSEKLAALGGVVAGVTHELNTPIGNALLAASTISSSISEVREKIADGRLKKSELEGFVDQAAELGALISRSLGRANELTRSFKRVAVDQASERRRTFHLNELVRDVVRTLTPSLGSRAPRITLEFEGEEMAMDSYPGALSQILNNLLQNATLHAFEGRDPGNVHIRARCLDDDRIELIVEDDGRGVPDSLQDRVFQPFFTTGVERDGSGLGLSICRSLVTSHLGGSIDLVSFEGRGCRFIMRFPQAAPQAAHESGERAP